MSSEFLGICTSCGQLMAKTDTDDPYGEECNLCYEESLWGADDEDAGSDLWDLMYDDDF